MEKIVVEGKVERKRTRKGKGDQMKSTTAYSLSKATKHAEEREQ